MRELEALEDPFINLNALDTLVLAHIRDKDKTSILANDVQKYMEAGDMLAVHELVSTSHELFKDPVLNFRIACQRFVELIRDDTQRNEALAYLRRTLAPMALDAYPEAYTELKNYLLAIIFSPGAVHSPVEDLWSHQSRTRLAGQCSRFVQEKQGCSDTKLVMLLKYLALSAQSLIDARPASVSKSVESAITEALNKSSLYAIIQNSMRKMAPNAPSIEGSCSNEFLDAVSIEPHIHMMMMKSLFELTREETMRSIRQAGCCLEKALRHELTALPHQKLIVDDLALEYAAYRGLDLRNESDAPQQAEVHASADIAALRDTAASEGEHERQTLKSTRKAYQRNPSRSPPKKLARCDTSWRGDSAEYDRGSMPPPTTSFPHKKPSPLQRPLHLTQDLPTVHFLGSMIRSGSVADAVGLVNQLDASLLKDAAGLHFQLQVAIFKQHVQEDRTSEAILCLQTVITPLAVQCEDAKLQRQSQDLAALLLLPEDSKAPDFHALADTLEEFLCARFEIKPCGLVSLLKTLLSAHIFWLDSQVSPDYFGKFLGLDDLQAGKAEREADGIFKHCNVLKASETGSKTEKGDSKQAPARESNLRESLISDAMDITNLSRAVVIPMLLDAGCDLQILLDRMFGGDDNDVDMDGNGSE